MSTHPTDTQDLSVIVESLRGQLTKTLGGGSNNRSRKLRPAPQLAELENQVTALLDLLDQRVEADGVWGSGASNPPSLPHAYAAEAQPPGVQFATEIVETLERSLAQWQAQITLAYSQGAAHELGEHLRSTIHLNEALHQRETRLESQRQSLEQFSAELLQRQARTQRQRRSIAHMLRAQKAEALRDIERQQHEWTEQLRQQESESSQHSAASNLQTEEMAQLQLKLQAAQDELAQAQQDWQSALAELEGSHLESQSMRATLDDMQNELKQARDELANTQTHLQDTMQLLQELEQSQSAQRVQTSESEELLGRLSGLETQLAAADQEIQDLKQQNFDLASQVAKHQVVSSGHIPHVSFDSSSLSWEERKKLIMQQLEDDSQDGDGANGAEQIVQRLEVEKVMRATQAEIDCRDKEIAELQAIIEQQSDTRQGVAIGAAAFAQAFDSDAVIQEERQKLKDIQLEWEQKLRQAEIDLSLERARLARERTHLEQELEETKREKAALSVDPAQSKKRKWLEHLGLRDESRPDS